MEKIWYFRGMTGNCYGDDQLSTIHLGSGGSGCQSYNLFKSAFSDDDSLKEKYNFRGTNGGGSIVIECTKNIIIEKGGKILANGENENNYWSGCGSGGSIYLKAKQIINNGLIQAIGGKNIVTRRVFNMNKNSTRGGQGGMGRIRIDCNVLGYGKIKPEVGHYGRPRYVCQTCIKAHSN